MSRRRTKSPLLVRLVPRIFPTLEKVFPSLAYRFASWIFLTPFRFSTPKVEKDFLKSGNKFELTQGNKTIIGHSWGEGKTIICVHGWSGRGGMFYKFINPLVSNKFRVVIFDGPAHGLSQGLRTDVLEFEDILLQLEERFAPAVGYITHSFGGTASLFTFSRNKSPKPIILIGVPAIGEEVVQEFRRRINGSHKIIKKLEDYMNKKYGATFYSISGIHTAKTIGNTPALVIHDKHDKEVSVIHAEKLMDSLTNGTFLRTTGLGHNRILRDVHVIEKAVEFLNHHCT